MKSWPFEKKLLLWFEKRTLSELILLSVLPCVALFGPILLLLIRKLINSEDSEEDKTELDEN